MMFYEHFWAEAAHSAAKATAHNKATWYIHAVRCLLGPGLDLAPERAKRVLAPKCPGQAVASAYLPRPVKHLIAQIQLAGFGQ